MSTILLMSSLIAIISSQAQTKSPLILPPVTLNEGRHSACSIDRDTRDSIRQNVSISLRPCSCGGPEWTRIVGLDMTNISQQCPSGLTLHTTPVRGCGRLSALARTCDSVIFSVSQTYSRVCGRILAYQRGTPDAFLNSNGYGLTSIEQPYVDGLSLTHGVAGLRRHIWTFAAALNVGDMVNNGERVCDCTNNHPRPHQEPFFVGNNYFCDTADPGSQYSFNTYYVDNPLWDGKGCATESSCCEFNTPPYFCSSLPQATGDNLEMRMCFGEGPSTEEDVIISAIDLFVA